VSTTTNAQWEVLGSCEFQRGDHVLNGSASQDEGWPTIDHAIPYSARHPILIVMRREKLTVEDGLPTIYERLPSGLLHKSPP
jgi:hypothetical protein